jgi:hypothetical protein
LPLLRNGYLPPPAPLLLLLLLLLLGPQLLPPPLLPQLDTVIVTVTKLHFGMNCSSLLVQSNLFIRIYEVQENTNVELP